MINKILITIDIFLRAAWFTGIVEGRWCGEVFSLVLVLESLHDEGLTSQIRKTLPKLLGPPCQSISRSTSDIDFSWSHTLYIPEIERILFADRVNQNNCSNFFLAVEYCSALCWNRMKFKPPKKSTYFRGVSSISVSDFRFYFLGVSIDATFHRNRTKLGWNRCWQGGP